MPQGESKPSDVLLPCCQGPGSSGHSEPNGLKGDSPPERTRGFCPGNVGGLRRRGLAGGSGSPFSLGDSAQEGRQGAGPRAGAGIFTRTAPEPRLQKLVTDGFQGLGQWVVIV